jgi:hypothetical protein
MILNLSTQVANQLIQDRIKSCLIKFNTGSTYRPSRKYFYNICSQLRYQLIYKSTQDEGGAPQYHYSPFRDCHCICHDWTTCELRFLLLWKVLVYLFHLCKKGQWISYGVGLCKSLLKLSMLSSIRESVHEHATATCELPFFLVWLERF